MGESEMFLKRFPPSKCIFKCKNGPNISFHRLPTITEQRDIWMKVLSYIDVDVRSRQYPHLCSRHFEDKYFTDSGQSNRRLRCDAVPTLFLEQNLSFNQNQQDTLDTSQKKTEYLDIEPDESQEPDNYSDDDLNDIQVISNSDTPDSHNEEDKFGSNRTPDGTIVAHSIHFADTESIFVDDEDCPELDIKLSTLYNAKPEVIAQSLRMLQSALKKTRNETKRLKSKISRRNRKIKTLTALVKLLVDNRTVEYADCDKYFKAINK